MVLRRILVVNPSNRTTVEELSTMEYFCLEKPPQEILQIRYEKCLSNKHLFLLLKNAHSISNFEIRNCFECFQKLSSH